MGSPEISYDRNPEFNQEEGTVTQAPDIGTLAVLNKSEIDQQIATAKAYPRNITQFRKEAMALVALDESTASECIYALPRDGKTIEGPSARFAEIVNYAWGNTRAGARTISEEGEFVKSQGLFYDLEKNTAISYEVSRRITDKRGNRFKADMIGVTSNAACSIALRNAILKGIPKAFWKPLYDAARKVVAGDIKTLANRRAEALKDAAIYGGTPERVCAVLGVDGVNDIGIDQLVVLRGILTAIREGDTTPEQAFAPPRVGQDDGLGKKADSNLADIANRYKQQEQSVNPQQPAAESQPAQTQPPAESEKGQSHRSPKRNEQKAPTGADIFGEHGR